MFGEHSGQATGQEIPPGEQEVPQAGGLGVAVGGFGVAVAGFGVEVGFEVGTTHVDDNFTRCLRLTFLGLIFICCPLPHC